MNLTDLIEDLRDQDEWLLTLRLDGIVKLMHEASYALTVLQAERAELIEALNTMTENFADASQYKGEYLAKKHGDAEELQRAQALLDRFRMAATPDRARSK